MHKSGFVNIIGNPNVGKSTIMNELVGEKISIITEKRKIEDAIYTFEEVDLIMSIMPQDNEYWFFPIYENKKIDNISKQIYKNINK